MTDFDREPGSEPRPVRETEHTTIIHDTGDRGGGSGAVMGLLVIIVVLAVVFFLFRGSFMGTTPDNGVHVNVAAPTVKVSDINVKVPDVKIEVPKVDVRAEAGNKAAAR